MIAKLEFDLENADARMQHLRCIKANKMFNVLFDFSCNSRKKIRHILEDNVERDNKEILDLVFQEFNELLEENYINIEELTISGNVARSRINIKKLYS